MHDPLRQRLGRGGVLSGVQLTVNNDVGLPTVSALEFSSELIDFVLQQETEILEMCRSLTLVHSLRKALASRITYLNRKAVLFLFRIGKSGGLLSIEDRFPVKAFA